MSVETPVAVVTGANKGIGLAVAQKLAGEGYSILACVRSGSSELDRLIESDDGHSVFNLDLSDDDGIKRCAKELLSSVKRVDVLVNCAGMATGSLFTMTRLDDIRETFNVNYFGQLLFTQYIVKKMMRARAGSIVNIASTAGLLADAGTLAYGGSKAALIHATKVMASELGPMGIRVNGIAPSVVETEMAGLMDDAARAKLDDRSALPGGITAGNIADTVVFLATSQSQTITGQIIRVDRGMPF